MKKNKELTYKVIGENKNYYIATLAKKLKKHSGEMPSTLMYAVNKKTGTIERTNDFIYNDIKYYDNGSEDMKYKLVGESKTEFLGSLNKPFKISSRKILKEFMLAFNKITKEARRIHATDLKHFKFYKHDRKAERRHREMQEIIYY